MDRLIRWLANKAIRYLPVVHEDDLAEEKLCSQLLHQRLIERGADFKKEQAARRKAVRALEKSNTQLRGKAGQVKKMAKELYPD